MLQPTAKERKGDVYKFIRLAYCNLSFFCHNQTYFTDIITSYTAIQVYILTFMLQFNECDQLWVYIEGEEEKCTAQRILRLETDHLGD